MTRNHPGVGVQKGRSFGVDESMMANTTISKITYRNSVIDVFATDAYYILLFLNDQKHPVPYATLQRKMNYDRKSGLFAYYIKMLKKYHMIKEHNYNKTNSKKNHRSYGYSLTINAVDILQRIEKTILAYKQITDAEQLEMINS